MICDRCNGSGWLTGKTEWQYTCDKCRGDGWVDWISHIMGKPLPPPRQLKGNWTMEVEQDLVAMHGTNVHEEIVNSIASELADKIDQEIMENLINISATKSKIT